MKMRVLTIAAIGGAMILSGPLASVAHADNMVDSNKCQALTVDLKWDLMLVGAGGKNYDTANQAMADAEDQHKKGEHSACVQTATKGIEDLGLPVNSYPE